MPTEAELALCEICFYRNRMVTLPGKKGKVLCGGPSNEHCPGFYPMRNNEVKR